MAVSPPDPGGERRVTARLGPDDVDRGVEILEAGGLVAFPTETVYGLGADASNPRAVDDIFVAKGRPHGHPLIVHLARADDIDQWIDAVDPRILALAAAFWPGPLTVVAPSSGRAVPAVTGGLPTIGLRVPDHPVAGRLLECFGGGLAAPSANRFGHVSPTTAAHVIADLDGRIDAVIDGGACPVGLESTIVELVGQRAVLLRPGGIPASEIEQVLGDELDRSAGEVRAPGMLPSHYAPGAPIRIVAAGDELGLTPGSAVIGPTAIDHASSWRLPADADGYGAGLYRALREADASNPTEIVIVPPTEGRLIEAVLDRLAKASSPRD